MSLILFRKRSRVFLFGLSLLGVLPVLQANVQIANLKQDLELIAREVAGLRTEVELLRRENAQLRVVLNQVSDGASSRRDDSQGILVQVNARVRKLEGRISSNESNTVKLQNTFDEKIRELIKQMNKNFEKVASAPSSPVTPSFSSDYPQNGFVHKVEKGETVSSIASKYKSKVKWIIDANQIADPTKVFIGKELFVPQK
jgi:LysM repeat protein